MIDLGPPIVEIGLAIIGAAALLVSLRLWFLESWSHG